MLELQNIFAGSGEKEILKGLNLKVLQGEIHAIMGPNGSGKSTLTHLLAGRPDIELTQGKMIFQNADLAEMKIEERARSGLFIASQYPVEVAGVNNAQFLRTAVNTVRKSRGRPEIGAGDFLKQTKQIMERLDMKPEMIKRALNEGFSGGEKKKNEILQMVMLDPSLVILDEIDSGLDVDALEKVATEVRRFISNEKSLILITHYSRILKYIEPQFVHILSGGKIIESGDLKLAKRIEEKGYEP